MDALSLPFEIQVLIFVGDVGMHNIYGLCVGAGVSLILLILVFPFYIYVNGKNEKRDEEVPVFIYSRHFYKMVKKIYFFLFIICIMLCFMYYVGLQQPLVIIGLAIPAFTSFLTIHITIQVFQFLSAFLVLLKFFTHFIPSTEQFVLTFQKFLHDWIYLIYIFVAGKDIVSIFSFVSSTLSKQGKSELSSIKENYTMVFIVFNISNILLSLSCIPVLISGKKRQAYSNPERYIVWQALNTVLFKLTTIPLGFLIHAHKFQPFLIVLFLMSVDNLVTPLLMQLSYLSCNKRNMMAIVKTLFCCNKRPSAVQPQYQPHGSSEDS